MVIEFDPGKIDVNDGDKLSKTAWMKVTLNGQVVFKDEFKDGVTKVIGTGSRSRVTDKNKPLESALLYLQSHWGSQVEYRNPQLQAMLIIRE